MLTVTPKAEAHKMALAAFNDWFKEFWATEKRHPYQYELFEAGYYAATRNGLLPHVDSPTESFYEAFDRLLKERNEAWEFAKSQQPVYLLDPTRHS